jgi:putative transposase
VASRIWPKLPLRTDFADPETAPTILPFTKFEITGESEIHWARLLAYVTGTVNQELLLRNEYLAAENRILRGQIKGRLLLSEGEKARLAEIGRRLGRRALEDVAATAKADTILGWNRKLVANADLMGRNSVEVRAPKLDEETER